MCNLLYLANHQRKRKKKENIKRKKAFAAKEVYPYHLSLNPPNININIIRLIIYGF